MKENVISDTKDSMLVHPMLRISKISEEIAFGLGPPAFLHRKFRITGNETWEILPRLIAEWTLATISEREPNVARAKLCLSIPKDVDEKTRDCMQTAFGLWLVETLERV